MLYKEMENMSVSELIEVRTKLMTYLQLPNTKGLEIALELIYGKYTETTVDSPEAIKVATDLITEYIQKISNIIANRTLKRYYVEVDQTLTTTGEYGITVNIYIILANSEEEAKNMCKEKYYTKDAEFDILECKLVDDLQEGLISSVEYYN